MSESGSDSRLINLDIFISSQMFQCLVDVYSVVLVRDYCDRTWESFDCHEDYLRFMTDSCL